MIDKSVQIPAPTEHQKTILQMLEMERELKKTKEANQQLVREKQALVILHKKQLAKIDRMVMGDKDETRWDIHEHIKGLIES